MTAAFLGKALLVWIAVALAFLVLLLRGAWRERRAAQRRQTRWTREMPEGPP